MQPHRQQPTRLPRPWDSPGKNTGVGCHFLLQCIKVKSESEVAQSCPTLLNPVDCSLPGSSVHGIFQARVLQWGAIAVSNMLCSRVKNLKKKKKFFKNCLKKSKSKILKSIFFLMPSKRTEELNKVSIKMHVNNMSTEKWAKDDQLINSSRKKNTNGHETQKVFNIINK